MKKYWIILTTYSLLVVSCSDAEQSDATAKEKPNATTELNTEDVSEELAELKSLYGEVVSGGPGVKIKAQQLFTESQNFVNEHPNHEKTPAVLEISAMSADILGKHEEAVNILHKLINDFPETEDTPKYMWNKAMIIEEKMGKIANAKAAYLDLVERFPNDPLAQDAKLYVENFLGKSKEEQFEFLDSVNTK